MADIKSQSEMSGKVLLVLTEGEARALEAICGYGPEVFVKWFYRNLGKHYLEPHERDMKSLFETVRSELPKHLSKFDNARKIFSQPQRYHLIDKMLTGEKIS